MSTDRPDGVGHARPQGDCDDDLCAHPGSYTRRTPQHWGATEQAAQLRFAADAALAVARPALLKPDTLDRPTAAVPAEERRVTALPFIQPGMTVERLLFDALVQNPMWIGSSFAEIEANALWDALPPVLQTVAEAEFAAGNRARQIFRDSSTKVVVLAFEGPPVSSAVVSPLLTVHRQHAYGNYCYDGTACTYEDPQAHCFLAFDDHVVVPAIRVARPSEASEVLEILLEAAAWLDQRGTPLWTAAELDAKAIAQDVNAGHYALATSDALAVGTLRFTLSDEAFWPDAVEGDAAYVHRLAVRRSHSGGTVSSDLLAWSASRAADLGRPYLRLDCDAARPRLRAFYERHGFALHSERQVGPFFVARYQKPTAV